MIYLNDFHLLKLFSNILIYMVSSIGFKLNGAAPITGFGIRRHRKPRTHLHFGIGAGYRHHVRRAPRKHVGTGIGRRVAGALVSKIGHAIVGRIASAVSGGSHRITGGRRRGRPRKPRATLLMRAFGTGHRQHHRRPRRVLF